METTNYAETLQAIATSATTCWTCGGQPNAANYGGLCDPCTEAKRQRLSRAAATLREHGQANTEMGRALTHLGY